jgi:sorbitol-specific phosphotransferase system component IIBC
MRERTMATIQANAVMEHGELVIYIWGKRVVVAIIPEDVEMTDKLAAKIAEAWNAGLPIVPRSVVKKLAADL